MILYVDQFLGGTVPEEVDQDIFTGANDLSTAAAASFTMLVDPKRNPEYTEDLYSVMEWEWMKATWEFNKKSKYINVEVLTLKGFMLDIFNDFYADLFLIQMAIFMVGLYTAINIGGLSPIHCRCCVTTWGLLCVAVCYFAGFSIAFNIGYKQSGVHNLMAFLLIGIGVDDMFVITNAVD